MITDRHRVLHKQLAVDPFLLFKWDVRSIEKCFKSLENVFISHMMPFMLDNIVSLLIELILINIDLL